MSDLHRQALGGRRTPARSRSKAAAGSTGGSRQASRRASRANSAGPSRHGTDDEGGWDSDGSVWRYEKSGLTRTPWQSSGGETWETNSSLVDVNSFGSLAEELKNLDERPEGALTWQQELGDRIVRITDKDRRKLATEGLEEALAAYNRTLQLKFAEDELAGKSNGIVDSLLRSIRAGKTEKETVLACQALALTVITDRDCVDLGSTNGILERTITDHESLAVKTAAIHSLGALVFFTVQSEEGTEEVMDFFHEIIESDGHNIGAGDDSATVAAAIEEWGLLLTHIDDAEEITDRSAEAFVDQLESTEIEVQVAAGEVVALLFEKAHRPHDDDEDSEVDTTSDEDYPSIIVPPTSDDPHPAVQKYTVYRNYPHLKKILTELSRSSTKRVSKKNRKTQHLAFTNILHTINHPLHGPNYSRALDLDGREQGSRLEVKVGQKGVAKLNTWWKLIRWNALRRFLSGGILVHWQENPHIFQSLPLIMEAPRAHKRVTARPDRKSLSPYD